MVICGVSVRWRLRGLSDGCTWVYVEGWRDILSRETSSSETPFVGIVFMVVLFRWVFSSYSSYKCSTSCSGCSAQCKSWFCIKKNLQRQNKQKIHIYVIAFFKFIQTCHGVATFCIVISNGSTIVFYLLSAACFCNAVAVKFCYGVLLRAI